MAPGGRYSASDDVMPEGSLIMIILSIGCNLIVSSWPAFEVITLITAGHGARSFARCLGQQTNDRHPRALRKEQMSARGSSNRKRDVGVSLQREKNVGPF